MKVIKQSYEIMDFEGMTMAQQVEKCGRICYKSEDRITDDSADKFCARMLKAGHNSVMEMSNIILLTDWDPDEVTAYLDSKYFEITEIPGRDHMIVSGSVRAFREHIIKEGDLYLPSGFFDFCYLHREYPELFPQLREYKPENGRGVKELSPEELKSYFTDNSEYFANTWVEDFSNELYEKHHKVAVRLITNRVVSHEIVRHRPCSFLQESQRYCNYSTEKFGHEVTFITPTGIETGTPAELVWSRSMRRSEEDYFRLLRAGVAPQVARNVLPNSCKTEIIVYASIQEWKHIFSLRAHPAADPAMRELMYPLEAEFIHQGIIKGEK